MNLEVSQKQRLGREGALMVLFGIDITDQDPVEALELTRGLVRDVKREIVDQWGYTKTRVLGVADRKKTVDETIQQVSTRWKIERMSVVDRNLLRIGAWELFHSEVPPIVTINACVELAKTYGEESTPGFVNGLLDQICTDHGIDVA